MSSLLENTARYKEVRSMASSIISDVLATNYHGTEQDFYKAILNRLQSEELLYDSGWYDPPPNGIGVLFDKPPLYRRLKYGTLRDKENWPQTSHLFGEKDAGLVYISPVDKKLGIIGDIGLTIYRGTDAETKAHLINCLELSESVAEFAQAGMEYGDIQHFAKQQMKKLKLDNSRMVTSRDKGGSNIGHTIPWTSILPSRTEQQIIDSKNLNNIKDAIADARVFVSAGEETIVPETGVFSIEPRVESAVRDDLPLGYFYLAVCFEEGKKSILSNLNEIFDVAGMDYIKSKYT